MSNEQIVLDPSNILCGPLSYEEAKKIFFEIGAACYADVRRGYSRCNSVPSVGKQVMSKTKIVLAYKGFAVELQEKKIRLHHDFIGTQFLKAEIFSKRSNGVTFVRVFSLQVMKPNKRAADLQTYELAAIESYIILRDLNEAARR